MIKLLASTIFSLTIISAGTLAEAATYTVKGKLKGASGYKVLLVSQDGSIDLGTVSSSGAFSIKSSSIKNRSLQLLNASGSYAGPLLIKRTISSRKGYGAFSGTLTSGAKNNTIDLGTVKLGSGFAFLAKNLEDKAVSKTVTTLSSAGAPTGAGTLGIPNVPASLKRVALAATGVQPGVDSDRDGVPNSIDADDDNDQILDGSDESTPGSETAVIPYTSLYLNINETLNQNIAPLTQSAIDAVIGGENKFGLAFFLPRRPNHTGAHVICPSTLTYCAPGTGTAVYSGLSESSPSLRGISWASYNADGSGFPNLEPINVGGFGVFAAGIQPRVGTASIRPGDTYIVEFMSGSRVASRATATLPPYFVTTPALNSFTVNGVDTTIDYSAPSIPGSNLSNTITIPAGQTLTVSFFRPQVSMPSPTGPRFVDNGHLSYGLLVSGSAISREFTCGGFYSGLSSTLTEGSSLGTASSPFAQDGATIWPIVDSADDGSPDAASPMSVTVNLGACLDRAGVARGNYQIALTAAGVPLTGGSNRAAQLFHVNIQ